MGCLPPAFGFARGIFPTSSYISSDFLFSGSYVRMVFSCFLFSYFLWNFVTYLHRKHILVSLFPTIRGLDRKIPSVSAFLYLRLMKLAPLRYYKEIDEKKTQN